jgi:plastocyanin
VKTIGWALAVLVFPTMGYGATHVIQIEGMVFKPAVLTVKPGDRVVWENKDVVPHTATTTPAAGKRQAFDSKQISAGARWSWTARGQGQYDYVCTFHPGMKGTLLVAE